MKVYKSICEGSFKFCPMYVIFHGYIVGVVLIVKVINSFIDPVIN